MSEKNIKNLLDTVKTVHFIGIGGISMSALALILHSNGYTVTGSDTNRENCAVLISEGIKVFYQHSADNIAQAQMVVYTAAIKPENPELSAARAAGIPCFERADLLGAIMSRYDCPIGIAGTHGKSTTTSMISCVLLDAGVDPTISIGAKLPEIDSNYYIGRKDYFVFESCEYAGSFLKFYPRISVILNIDRDHLDFYKDLEDITSAFAKYVKNTAPGGVLVTNAADPNCMKISEDFDGTLLTFGMKDADYTPANIEYNAGFPAFDIMHAGRLITRVQLRVPGEHNIKNALAAAAVADYLHIGPDSISKGLQSFSGAQRRFELKGKGEGYTVIDDYAHHPSEIEATIRAARNMDFDKIILIFQPHTYSRTKSLLPQFKTALSLADNTILCDIYAAREKDDLGVSSQKLAAMIAGAQYAPSFEDAAKMALELVTGNSLILTMGAGDVFKTAGYLLK